MTFCVCLLSLSCFHVSSMTKNVSVLHNFFIAEQHSTIWIYFICLSIQLMDTWVISTFGYYDLCCNEHHAQVFDRHIFSIILHIKQIAGSHVNVYLTLRNCQFLNNLYHFIFPPTMSKILISIHPCQYYCPFLITAFQWVASVI